MTRFLKNNFHFQAFPFKNYRKYEHQLTLFRKQVKYFIYSPRKFLMYFLIV